MLCMPQGCVSPKVVHGCLPTLSIVQVISASHVFNSNSFVIIISSYSVTIILASIAVPISRLFIMSALHVL